MTPIKSCPFCGHVGLDYRGSTSRWLAYSCGGCGMGSETRIKTLGTGTPDDWRAQAKLDAIKEWNTRAQPAAEPVEQEQFAAFLERERAVGYRAGFEAALAAKPAAEPLSDATMVKWPDGLCPMRGSIR